MEQTFLSIKDFAARAKVSPQAIYKRLNNPLDELRNWLKTDGKRKMLDTEALFLFQSTQESTVDNQPVDNDSPTVEQQLIAMLQAELAAKNDQIATLQQLLSQEQQLRLVADQRLAMLEAPKEPDPEPAAEAAQDVQAPAEPTQEQPRRPWWQFWK